MSSVFPKNLFYAPKSKWNKTDFGEQVTIEGQEARHISKVLRYKEGDTITVADGEGVHLQCEITQISKSAVIATGKKKSTEEVPDIKKVIAFGAIKTRDRLEFAIEKAVELDAWEICIFDSDHSERSRINEDRLNTQIVSAFKQSCRYFLPKLVIKDSIEEVFEHYLNYQALVAYVGDDVETKVSSKIVNEHNLLMVGPEGGFSSREIELCKKRKAEFIDLGKNRLRAETAVAAFLSLYILSN